MPTKLLQTLTALEGMVLWVIYHGGLANENYWIILSNDPVFNNIR